MAFPLATAKGLLHISRLAYDPPDEVRSELREKDVRVRRSRVLGDAVRFVHEQSERADTEAYVLRNARGDVIVSFRGSEKEPGEGMIRDWLLTDADVALVDYSLLPAQEGARLLVHRGFQRGYVAVRTPLREAIREQLAASEREGRHVLVTGHSLGACLAVMAAFDLSRTLPVPVQLYAFGAARVGNAHFAKAVGDSLRRSLLIVNDGDPVAYLPPAGPKLGKGTLRYAHPRGVRTLLEDGSVQAGLSKAELKPRFKQHSLGPYREALDALG